MSVTIHVWSDIVCPWCFVGARRLLFAIEEFGEPVDLEWHSFELDPARTNEKYPGRGDANRLARKFGMPLERAQAMTRDMTELGKKEGIPFALDQTLTLQSFDAHRLLHFAREAGRQTELKMRLFEAHFTQGIDCGDASELIRLATEVGLDADGAASVLAGDTHATDVRDDEDAARELGIRGVPFFLFGRYAVSGAQQKEVLLSALDRAHLDGDSTGEQTDA